MIVINMDSKNYDRIFAAVEVYYYWTYFIAAVIKDVVNRRDKWVLFWPWRPSFSLSLSF